MSARIIDGKAIAAEVREEVRAGVAALRERTGRVPGLAAVLVGDDPASATYVRSKRKACEEAGIASWLHALPANTPQADLVRLILDLDRDPAVHGILVQLPLPPGIEERAVLENVDPAKDVDGLTFSSIGRLVENRAALVPCTPAGILELLDHERIPVEGKEAVVVGRSEIVGKPTAMLLLHRHATVTICHSRTKDLAGHCRRADILVAAVGRAKLITGDMVKPGAAVIDVGMNRVEGRLMGDVDFDSARERAGHITPVPGGVGPMTIALLLRNTLEACRCAGG